MSLILNRKLSNRGNWMTSRLRDRSGINKSGVTKITFWHGINLPENREIFQVLVDRFNQSRDDLEVEALYIGQPDTQLPKILAATVSGQPPDLHGSRSKKNKQLLKNIAKAVQDCQHHLKNSMPLG